MVRRVCEGTTSRGKTGAIETSVLYLAESLETFPQEPLFEYQASNVRYSADGAV